MAGVVGAIAPAACVATRARLTSSAFNTRDARDIFGKKKNNAFVQANNANNATRGSSRRRHVVNTAASAADTTTATIDERVEKKGKGAGWAVSYTHLTLPTILLV